MRKVKMARPDLIIDSRLSINQSLGHAVWTNSQFLINSANLGHLANQLLLYDKIVIPTKDFGIVPILITWFGLEGFERALTADSIHFLHRPDVLGYAGNGGGIGGFIIEQTEKLRFDWWQEALFGDPAKAIELQLKFMCPFVERKHRETLVDAIHSRTRALKYTNDFFMKHIVRETNTDIATNSVLTAEVVRLSGVSGPIDLMKVPGVNADQIKVSNTDHITSPADLILRVAEINMTLVMGLQCKADVFVPEGSQFLLKAKLARCGISPTGLEKFASLLDLANIPDPGAAVGAGELTLNEIWRIRRRRSSRKFRKWLREADTHSVRDLERMYVASLGHKTFYEKLPLKVLRFAITTAAGVMEPVTGTILGATDSFFVEQWLKGYSPKVFLDRLRKLQME